MVHGIDQRNGWYIGQLYNNTQLAERLAYSTEEVVAAARNNLGPFEDGLKTGAWDADPTRILQAWENSWRNVQFILSNPYSWGSSGSGIIGAAGVADVAAKLRVSLSCSQLLPIYQEMVDQRVACVCLSCQFTSFQLDPVFA